MISIKGYNVEHKLTGACVQLLMANVALKVFRFLMLYQNFLIVKFTIAVPKLEMKPNVRI